MGSNIHFSNDYPLRVACKKGFGNIADFLLKKGADIHAKNDHALILAVKNHQYPVVDLLIENGADFNKHLETVVYEVLYWGYLELFEKLLTKGVSVTKIA